VQVLLRWASAIEENKQVVRLAIVLVETLTGIAALGLLIGEDLLRLSEQGTHTGVSERGYCRSPPSVLRTRSERSLRRPVFTCEHDVGNDLFVAALCVSGAIFLILELHTPYGGLLRLSSTPLWLAYDSLSQ
jgi:hypothetical protein